MNPKSAILIAQALSLFVCVVLGLWYAVPWLKARSRVDALMALVWVHVFRNLALQLYSSQQAGLIISNASRDHAVFGDLAGMLLALLALFSLRYRTRFSTALVWLLVAETFLDIGVATFEGVRDDTMGLINGTTWLIIVYYVPLMMVTLGLTVWQLVSRHREPQTASATY